jgi:hypothetical protein
MPRRSGATLLEVLVAILVMGIGMLALLTLFPLGVLRMAKGIQDQKCAEAGASARCVWTMKTILTDGGLTIPTDGFVNPLNPKVLPSFSDALPEGPSYPIFVDPTGWLTATPGFKTNLAGNSLIARRSVSFVAANQDAFRWFTQLDDIDFESAATGGFTLPGTPRSLVPVPPAPQPSFVRDIRYSYAFLCQRPRQADTSIVDTSVVVYNKRPLSGAPGGLSLSEYAYPTSTFNPTNNTILIDYSAGGLPPPALRAGDWVLDASPVYSAPNVVVSAHGYFYRVVEVSDGPTPSTLQLEVETPLRGFTGPTVGTAIVLDGVAEVFTNGTARLP